MKKPVKFLSAMKGFGVFNVFEILLLLVILVALMVTLIMGAIAYYHGAH
jgi:hypothetical protein